MKILKVKISVLRILFLTKYMQLPFAQNDYKPLGLIIRQFTI